MSEHQVDHISGLIETKRKTLEETQSYLAKVENQAALYGTNTPPKMQIEMEELQKKIDRLQGEIEGLEKEREKVIKSAIPGNLMPGASGYSTTKDHRVSTKGIAYWVSTPVIAIIFILADTFFAYPNLQEAVIYEQVIDANYHHLGDNVYSQEYVDSIVGDKPHSLSAEGIAYTTTFDLKNLRRLAKVADNARVSRLEFIMFVNHVKNRQTAPILIGVNGEYLAHLNDYVKAEEFHREPITILVDVPLYDGQNEIEIVTGKDTEQSVAGFDEYEDFEFDSLGIRIAFDEKHLRTWPFVLVVLVEILVLGYMGMMISRSLT